jgi:peptidoglycan-N-acetylglucosamine deacetylase
MKLRRRQGVGRADYSPTAGLHFDDEEFESRIVWIWTTARSGSTWLLKMLTHPLKLVDSGQDPEDLLGFLPPRTWQGTVDAIPVDTTFVSNHLLPLAGSADYTDDLMPITFSAALGIRNRGNYFFSPKYEDAWRPEVRRMMLVRFHRLVERAAERYDVKSPLVLLKEVAGAHAAPLVMSMFPRSKLVFLVRDGRDVVDSQTAANQPGGWLPVGGWTTPEERYEYIRRRGRTWVGDVASIERALQAHPAELRKTIRYEDLLAAPAENLGPLVKWLGLRRSEQWLERAVEANAFASVAPEQKGPKKFFRSATPGAWRKNMTDEEAAALESVMGDKLRELGYPAADGPSDAEESSGDDGSPGPGVGAFGQGKASGDIVSAAVRQHGEGRDYTDLGRLIQKRGSPASRRDRKVALTFDDGPVLQTHRVLETLERYGARGTFFLVGYKFDGHQDLIERLLSGGHQIGNHSHGHFAFPTRDDVAACTALIEHASGARPKLFRPPFGAIDRPAAEAAIEDGMRVLLWSVDSKDGIPPWKGISAEEIARNVLDSVAPGAVILLHDGLPWSRAADALPEVIEGLQGEGYRLVTVNELLANPAPQRPSPAGRVMRRLRRAVGTKDGTAQAEAPPAQDPDGDGSAPKPAHAERSDQEHLGELLQRVAEGVEVPEELEAGPAGRLIRGACLGLTDRRTASELIARHAAAYEVNAVRVIALGFSLRAFEAAEGGAAPLTEPFSGRLRSADDPIAEAGLIAQELAGRMRVNRLIAARLAKPVAEAASVPTKPRISEATGVATEPGTERASPEFLSIFAPGIEVWERLEEWARDTGRGVARQRMRALLDAAGVDDGFDIERLVQRLDVDFYFRFGYGLAACGEELSRADS